MLSEFESYENTLTMRKTQINLLWNNAAMKEAELYYKAIYDEKKELSEIIVEVEKQKLRGVIALLYGAIKAANPKMDIRKFNQLCNTKYYKEYLSVVADGIKNYLPEPAKDLGEGVDESWPDTQAEIKKKKGSKKISLTGDSGSGFSES